MNTTATADGGRVDADAIIETAIRATTPTPLELGNVYVITGLDGLRDYVDLTPEGRARTLDTPHHRVGNAVFSTPEAFAHYVTRHHTPGASEVYADNVKGQVVAVLDSDTPGGNPGWRQHRATLKLVPTTSWTRWAGIDRKLYPQVEFAEFVEDRITDIIDPPAADLLELAQSMRAHRESRWESSKRLSNGETNLVFQETLNATAGHRGQMTIPEEIALALAPWEGGDPIRVTARLRYRISDAQLRIGVILNRPEDVLSLAFDDIVSAVVEGTPGDCPVYSGTAPDPR